jgi:DNA-binding SARP family transcriptional activator
MEFGLLGPLVIRTGGDALLVPQGNQRTLLAALLLDANQVVPVDQIAEALWEGTPPPSAPATIRNYVKRLRQALGQAGHDRISTRRHGYVISLREDELDVSRFRNLLSSARAAARVGSWDQAAGMAREALSLWRGEPLADIESDALALPERLRLDELRLQAQEILAEAELQLGRHHEALADLQRLAADHPLREHLHALLMLALHRCGRQADALAAYQQARTGLIDELGIEPGTELNKLQQQILAADPALDLAGPADKAAQARPEGKEPGTSGGLAPAAPRQLPAAAAHFTGRDSELAALTGILDTADSTEPTTVVIGGTAGVGKTALAIRWAHQVASRFPDGQLYVNLRGFDPSGAPVTPAEAIRGFLDALGAEPGSIPASQDAQQGLYRSLLADRRMLIVLDNAHDEQQVRPLLPAVGSLVLVTSRSQLTGLAAADSARLLTLDILTPADATLMLTARLGASRADAEPESVTEIVRLCGYLPLALAVSAARAAARPGFPLAALAAELCDATGHLDALDAGDPASSVRVVFSWSYQQLSPPAAQMFRLLGLHPGPDTSGAAAASLAGISPAEARRALSELSRAHLIAEHVPGRYAFHDLLRAYAADQSAVTDSDAGRREAVGRLLDHYLQTTRAATALISPIRRSVDVTEARPGVTPESMTDLQGAVNWLDTEYDVLSAAASLASRDGFDVHAWQLPWAMGPFLSLRGRAQEKVALQQPALEAAIRLGDTTAQGITRRVLAIAYNELGDYDRSLAELEFCLELYRQLGDTVGEALVEQSLSFATGHQERYQDALQHAENALRLFRTVGERSGEGLMLNYVGWCHALLGDYQKGRDLCQQAVTVSHEAGNGIAEAASWDSVGYCEYHLGHRPEADRSYHRALELYRELGDRHNEALTLASIGDARQAWGEPQQARDAWRRALAILDDLQHPDAAKIRAQLAAADDRADRGSVAAGGAR